MHPSIQKLMAQNYALFNPLWKIYFPLRTGAVHQPLAADYDGDVFSEVYRNNYWGNAESVSGTGSTLAYTAPLRSKLPSLLRKYGIRRIFDAPCGDFNWMRAVDLGDREYIGGDLVPDLVDRTRSQHERAGRSFVVSDITNDSPPDVDLWICRDVLFHLKFDAALAVLRNMAASNVCYFLSTSYGFVRHNVDLERTGGFRHINLQAAPFNLPPPLERIDDFVVPAPPRFMGLWSREQIVAALAR